MLGRWLSMAAVVAMTALPAACDKAQPYGGDRQTDDGFVPLFAKDGIPDGWVVRAWNDVAKPAADANWAVAGGVLRCPTRRGTWLMSRKTYGDFILEYEAKLSAMGNSGLALRAPMKGDPAFDGMELQMADFRYNPRAAPSELTGGIYRAIAPAKQVYKPTEWNRFRVELSGTKLKVTLNDVVIHDTDLTKHTQQVPRHDRTLAPAIKDRPRTGHIGFQHLSRDTGPVLIRKARIKELSGGKRQGVGLDAESP